ncbi:MAG: polyhydroxyalkanoate synthesis regulator DNA-binding domain-containing protein [Chloroflexota bacterium]|nr:MAG: pesticidal protein Cry15Aa [Bellilinea sp.]
MLHIKRYSNRKLYDTDNRRYITLPEIAKYLREGEEVQVIDHDSGVDLTTLVMLQALFSAEKRLGGWLPTSPFGKWLDFGEKNLPALLASLFGRDQFDQLVNREISYRLEQLVNAGNLSPEEAAWVGSLLLKPAPQPVRSEMPQPPARHEALETLLADLERLSTILDELSNPPAD